MQGSFRAFQLEMYIYVMFPGELVKVFEIQGCQLKFCVARRKEKYDPCLQHSSCPGKVHAVFLRMRKKELAKEALVALFLRWNLLLLLF